MLARTSIISWMVSGGNFVDSMRYAETSLSGFQYAWSLSKSMTWSSGLIGVLVFVDVVSLKLGFPWGCVNNWSSGKFPPQEHKESPTHVCQGQVLCCKRKQFHFPEG